MTQVTSTLPASHTPQRYHPAIVVLHWLIAILIGATAYFALAFGEGRRQFGVTIAGLPPIGIHMILGIAVLVLLLLRLIVRLTTSQPSWASTGSRFLDVVGVLTHWGLYALVFAITVTGLILALQTNRLARVFNPSTAPQNGFASRPPQSGQNPPAGSFQPGQLPPSGGFQPGQFPGSGQFPRGGEGTGGFGRGFREGGGFFLGAFHGLAWVLLILLLIVHVGAALYHQFLRRDGLFGRMWFGKRYA